MHERFGATGRTASLLNNPKTVMDAPIASATSLRRVLKRVGEVMDRDDDILFLFLTSHGAKDHKFSLEFWPLQFNDLTPQVLRGALDDAGIQWRVIVVSACYAGGFINALKGERTIVIAAAGPDRKSFGCSHEAQWTHFGEAFFDQALRAEPRVTQAFALAREAVTAREKKEKRESPSDPRMAAGAAMERQWDAYLAQLSGTGAGAHTAAKAPAPDAVDQLVALGRLPEIASIRRLHCTKEMAGNSPSAFLEKDPGYFGGLTRESPQWPKLVAAWERFAEEYCESTNDVELLRRAYTDGWRQAADAATVQTALKYLRTPEGKKLLDARNRATLAAAARFSELRLGPAEAATSRYAREMTRLYAEIDGQTAKAAR
jgi:hypothetical protein